MSSVTGKNRKERKKKKPLLRADQDHIRVAAVQYKQRKVRTFEDFVMYIEYFIRVVAEYEADFVLFPEAFPMQLMSMLDRHISGREAIKGVAEYTERFKALMLKFAAHYHINIVAGSIATKVNDEIHKVSHVFLRDGSVYYQGKVHPTPDEREIYHLGGATQVNVIKTDKAPIGVLISYDIEFPELARHLVDQGALILFVPYCADQRSNYLRVRYCAQARAVEDQCYVVMAGNVGNLPDVSNMNVQYGQSCILTPCDFPFARDGIAAETSTNVETIVFADLNVKTLLAARQTGSVLNLQDRRSDLYAIKWHVPISRTKSSSC